MFMGAMFNCNRHVVNLILSDAIYSYILYDRSDFTAFSRIHFPIQKSKAKAGFSELGLVLYRLYI